MTTLATDNGEVRADGTAHELTEAETELGSGGGRHSSLPLHIPGLAHHRRARRHRRNRGRLSTVVRRDGQTRPRHKRLCSFALPRAVVHRRMAGPAATSTGGVVAGRARCVGYVVASTGAMMGRFVSVQATETILAASPRILCSTDRQVERCARRECQCLHRSTASPLRC